MSNRKFALNSSTLFPFALNVMEQIKIASEAGYDGIELWVEDIVRYLETGGTIKEIRHCLEGNNISLVNAITFFKWSDIDSNTRKEGLDQAEREMSMLKELCCQAVTAPPTGDVANVSLKTMAANFVELTKIARRVGVEPYLEFWGRSKTLSTLSEAMYVAMETGSHDVKILIDPFHMYTGGSSFDSLHYLKRKHVGIIHVNDYPAYPPRDKIMDSDRLFPGEGIVPSEKIVNYLAAIHYDGYLSLELFIESYGNQTPLEVASQGLKKMKQIYL